MNNTELKEAIETTGNLLNNTDQNKDPDTFERWRILSEHFIMLLKIQKDRVSLVKHD